MDDRRIALLYHDLVPEEAFDTSGLVTGGAWRYKLALESFEAHLQRIDELGATVGLVDQEPDGNGVPDLLMTFDDGGRSCVEHAAPMLEAHGLLGHFFIVTDRIGDDRFLDRDDVARLHDRGHHVGSHTATHPDLTALRPSARREELARSKRVIEDVTGESCQSLSIPGGAYDDTVLEDARYVGYDFVFTSDPEPLHRGQTFGRWNIWHDTTADQVESILCGDPLYCGRFRLRWKLLGTAKTLLGRRRFIRLRDRFIGG